MGVFSQVWTATSSFFKVQQTVLFVNRSPPAPSPNIVITPSPSPPPRVEKFDKPSGPIMGMLISMSGVVVATLSWAGTKIQRGDLKRWDERQVEIDRRTVELEAGIEVLERELSKATLEANNLEAKV